MAAKRGKHWLRGIDFVTSRIYPLRRAPQKCKRFVDTAEAENFCRERSNPPIKTPTDGGRLSLPCLTAFAKG